MIVEKAIYTLLSGINDGRVYAMRAPDNMIQDFLTFQKISTDVWRSVNAPSGIRQVELQVDCYSQIYYNSKQTALTVSGILDGFRGTVSYGSNSPQDEVRIGGISLQDEDEVMDTEEEPALYRVSQTYLITYEQG